MNPAGEAATTLGSDPLFIAPLEKGLRKSVIGGFASFMSAVASTGPALVLATVVGVVVAMSGHHAVGVLLVAAVPMLMVARSFWELDVAERDCGTTFIWVGRALGPTAGFLSAWGQLGAGLMIVPGSAYTLAQYTLSLFGRDDLTGQLGWNIGIGLTLILAIGAICFLGVEIAALVQRLLVIVEVVLVVMLIVVAVVKIGSGATLPGATHFSLNWLDPFGGGSVSDALVVAIFAYWGWDISFTLGEESRGATTPGRASVYSILALVIVYIVGASVFLAYAGTEFVGDHATTLLASISDSLLGQGIAKSLITLAVLSSAIAATQATFVSGSRLLLSMGAYRSLPAWFSRTNKRNAPVATGAIVLAGAVLFVVMTTLSTTVLFDSLSCTGIIICFYYGLTVFSCAWRFRSTYRTSLRSLVWRGVVPLVSGIILAVVFVKSLIGFANPASSGASMFGIGGVFWLAVGYLAVGVVLAGVLALTAREFMSGRTMQPGYDPGLASGAATATTGEERVREGS